MTEQGTMMVRRCRTCQGEGIIEDYHCRLCSQRIADEDEWWESDNSAMPCGHDEENLVETVTCPECDGAGRSEQWLTPAEVQAIQRGKMTRIAFVVGLSLILMVVLVVIVLTSLPERPFCGTGWYSSVLLLFAVNHLRPQRVR